MTTEILLGTASLLGGLWLLWWKYRVILGGTLYQAEIIRFQFSPDSNGDSKYYLVRFIHDGIQMTKKAPAWSRIDPKKDGKTLSVYYNEKYPKTVWIKGISLVDLAGILFSLMGGFLLLQLVFR